MPTVETAAGRFAVVDYGGAGPHCLLIHGTGQNAAAWRDLAAILARRWRVLAFDLRGHGQTREDSSDAEQYWRDIPAVAAALGVTRPLLVGHSSGAYAATAHAASGGDAAGVVCVDGFTPDGLEDVRRAAREAGSEATRRMLFDMFRYGWRATAAERDAHIEAAVAAAPGDWLNDGVPPELLASMLRRYFVEEGGAWLRRPTLEEIAVVGAPDAGRPILPWRGIYDMVDVPLLFVWADRGLSADRRGVLEAIAAARPNRRFAALGGSHNLPMQRPAALAATIETHFG
jgi:pimeloyl-ACP methyl ester carboxylesterase